MAEYKLSKCKICGLIKALKNDICANCENTLKNKDYFSELFGTSNLFNLFKGFGGKIK